MTEPAQMMPMPQVGVEGRAAEEYVAFESLTSDMRMVEMILSELLSRPSVDKPDEQDVGAVALWNAAIVGYGRCYKRGRRKGYVNQLRVPEDHRKFHDWILGLRDEYVAHLSQDNLGEQARVIVLLDAVGDRKVDSLMLMWMRLSHPERTTIETFREVARAAITQFEEASKAVGQRLFDHLQRQPVEPLYRAARERRSIRVEEIDDADEKRGSSPS